MCNRYGLFFLLIIPFALIRGQDDKPLSSVSYLIPIEGESKRERDSSGIENFIVSGGIYLYRNFISDLDGDNCPFYPSCSEYLVEAVGQSGLFSGMLLFADRFTRDLNIFRNRSQYPQAGNGKLFDPPSRYQTGDSSIKNIFYIVEPD